MRVERIDLVAFGKFTDVALDLSAPGLQVVYGPNEAGKTTARAAVSNLLYDFELRTTYAFVHPMSKLQLGARLSSLDGTTIEVVRHKRNKDPLVEAGSGTPVSPSRWAGLLQGVSRPDFEAMFTLGWDDLVHGTAEMIAQGGVLGETLFSAGLGARKLGAVLKHLDEEAATLYSTRPSTRIVNAALKAHAEALKRSGELSVRPSHYVDVLKDHDKSAESAAKLGLERRERERDHIRLVTLRGVLQTLQDRANKLDERSKLVAQGPVAPAAWAERVQKALEERGELTRARSTAADQLRSAAEKLDATTLDDGLLAIAERVDALAEGIASYVQGRSDRGGLDEGRRDAERDALGAIRDLIGGEPGVDALDEARAVLAGKDAFGPARDTWAREQAAVEHARADLREVQDEIARTKDALGLLPEVADPGPLRDVVDVALRQGDLDDALRSARSALASTQSALLELAGRLGLAEHEVAGAVASPAPSDEEIGGILGTLGAAETKARSARELAQHNALREAELLGELEALAHEAELPSEEDLAEHRKVRDEAWALVKASWLDHRGVTGEGTSYADQGALAASYEQASEAADRVVDRLWHEAERTARRNGLTAELAGARAEGAAALEQAQQASDAAAEAYSSWCSAWPAHRLPERPEGLRQWAVNLERLRALHAEWTSARRAHREAFRNLRRHRERLAAVLSTFGVEVPTGVELAPVRDRACSLLDGVEHDRDARSEKERRLVEIERGLPNRQSVLANALQAEKAAAGALGALLGPYGKGVTSSTDAGKVLARLDQLERLLETRDNRLQRISGIDRRSGTFERELRDLLTSAPDVTPAPPADAARELVARVKLARSAGAARGAIEEARASAQATLDDADAKLKGLEDELVLLARESGLDEVDKLGAAADRALRIAELTRAIGECETLLGAQGGGRTIAELEADGRGRDFAELNAAIEESEQSLSLLSDQEKEANATKQGLAAQLEAMDGSDAAASEAARAQHELARAIEGAERYTRVVLARFIADEAVRRYSQAHQDPLLGHASRYLGLLTGGRCKKIGIAESPKKGPHLTVIFAEGDERSVPQLSDGTRDQLYFALRLAAIQEASARTGPMPVVLDDVLVNFDDDRARAALRCLATLSEQTQVLLFTHHRHVVVLAEEAVMPGALAVHELA